MFYPELCQCVVVRDVPMTFSLSGGETYDILSDNYVILFILFCVSYPVAQITFQHSIGVFLFLLHVFRQEMKDPPMKERQEVIVHYKNQFY